MKSIDDQLAWYRRSIMETLDTLNLVIGILQESSPEGGNPVLLVKPGENKYADVIERYPLDSLIALRKGVLKLKFIKPNNYVQYLNANKALVYALADYLNEDLDKRHHTHPCELYRYHIMKRNFLHLALLPYLDKLYGREGKLLHSW